MTQFVGSQKKVSAQSIHYRIDLITTATALNLHVVLCNPIFIAIEFQLRIFGYISPNIDTKVFQCIVCGTITRACQLLKVQSMLNERYMSKTQTQMKQPVVLVV